MDCSIRLQVDSTAKERIPEANARLEKLHELRQKLRDRLAQANERMAKYYNQNHVPKQFKVKQLVKLLIKNLKIKHLKLVPCWVSLF